MASTTSYGQLFSTSLSYVYDLLEYLIQPPNSVHSSIFAESTAASLTIAGPPNVADPSTEKSSPDASYPTVDSSDSSSKVESSNEANLVVEDSSIIAGSNLASAIHISDKGSPTIADSLVERNSLVEDSVVEDSLDSPANPDASFITMNDIHTEPKAAFGKKVHICEYCDEPARRKCSGCFKVWYCSTSCQRACWYRHIFECNPRRSINSADYLHLAAVQDTFPRDKQTCEDYGFTRAYTGENKSELIGLYQNLIQRLGVESQTLHKWRINGVLSQEIIAAFNRLPSNGRGQYFPWFLQNQYVLDHILPLPDHESGMLQRAWQFIGGSASDSDADINVVMRIMPKHKVKCLMFYKTLLGYWYPRVDQDFYIEFGFCAYDEPGQSWLGFRYMDLINACTFDEFCDAYKSSSILSRLDLAIGCNMFCSNNCPDLSDVLHGSPDMFKSVWYLIQMLNAEVPKEVPAVMVDYGFVNCRDEGERKALMDVYRKVLRMSKPLKLHEAAVQGKLFDYAGGLVKLKKKFKRLMKNPYPSASF